MKCPRCGSKDVDVISYDLCWCMNSKCGLSFDQRDKKKCNGMTL